MTDNAPRTPIRLDAGSLPHSRQVGVTGRSIAPRLYLALGTSGSDHHTAGLGRAGTIGAVVNPSH
ncbi:MAG: FAD-binding protein [Spirillospora sp.]